MQRKNRNPIEGVAGPVTRTGEFQLASAAWAHLSTEHAEKVGMRFVKVIGALFGTGLCIGLLKGA